MPEMDYTQLLNRARECGYLTQKELACAANISEGQFCQKILGNYAFKQTEISTICELLKIQAEDIGQYFFTPKVAKTQRKRLDTTL